MPCYYCPCNFCKRKRPENGADKQKPPEGDREEGGTEGTMSTGDSSSEKEFPFPIPPFRPGEDDSGVPAHIGPIKQLYAATGHNLSILSDGTVRGTQESFSKWAVLELSSPGVGEVRIRGVEANLYLAMDDRGRLYAKADGTADDTIFLERLDNYYNTYMSRKHADKNWYVGIKKSGKPKNAAKTERNQKAVRFLPRPAYPKPT